MLAEAGSSTDEEVILDQHSVMLDQYVYALGWKCVSMKVTESVECFHIIQRQWSSMPRLGYR